MCISCMSWVDEDDCLSSVELCPDTVEFLMTEIMVVVSIASEKNDTIRVKYVKGVSDFFQRPFFIDEGGERGEEAVTARVIVS